MAMRWSLSGAIALLASTSLLAAPAVPLAPRRIPAQEIPVPGTVSPALQARIGEGAAFVFPKDLPKSNAGWNAWNDAAETDRNVAQLLDRLKLDLKEERIAGVRCFVITPHGDVVAGRLLVHIHGGGYVLGAGKGGIHEALMVAGTSRIRTIAIDYRMAPDYPFPTPVDDATAVWKAVTAANPGVKIGLFGTSTGGAMVLAVTQRAIAERLRVPDAIVAATPWSDISDTGDSYATNRYLDSWNYPDILGEMARQYAHGADMHDPRLSPVYGSFANFPPTLLISGTRDIFLSNTVRVDRKLRDAGRESELIVYEAQSHAAYLAGLDVPETRTWLDDVARFWGRRLKR